MLNTVRENIINVLNGDAPKEAIPTAIQFSEQVEEHSIAHHCTLIESMAEMVDIHNLDIQDTPKLITSSLKEKLGVEQGIIIHETGLPLG